MSTSESKYRAQLSIPPASRQLSISESLIRSLYSFLVMVTISSVIISHSLLKSRSWWTRSESSRQPSACKATALPTELQALNFWVTRFTDRHPLRRYSAVSISVILTAKSCTVIAHGVKGSITKHDTRGEIRTPPNSAPSGGSLSQLGHVAINYIVGGTRNVSRHCLLFMHSSPSMSPRLDSNQRLLASKASTLTGLSYTEELARTV